MHILFFSINLSCSLVYQGVKFKFPIFKNSVFIHQKIYCYVYSYEIITHKVKIISKTWTYAHTCEYYQKSVNINCRILKIKC